MADIKSPEARSLNMSRIRSRDTKPEEFIRKKLYAHGYRYRKNSSRITGHPDLWLARYNTAVFINGCFWHRHSDCKYAYTPKSRVEFWKNKFNRNVKRDKYVMYSLRDQGIRTLIIWECTVRRMIKDADHQRQVMDKIEGFLRSSSPFLEL